MMKDLIMVCKKKERKEIHLGVEKEKVHRQQRIERWDMRGCYHNK
jgi:hypothetical protein